MAKTHYVPEGYRTLTPYLIVDDANKALEFYKDALGATELFRFEDKGKVGHAEMQIGDSRFMLADEYPDMGTYSPKHYKGSPISLMIYVENVDFTAEQATKAGMKIDRPVANQFYGDRSGNFIDPFGHVWTISTHVEDVSPEEMEKRAKEASSK